MIYVDTSVALATLFNEARQPTNTFWSQDLASSRLLEYEVVVRLNAVGVSASAHSVARTMLGGIRIAEMAPQIVARVLQPFPIPVRTLDALHLATMVFLRDQGNAVELASYDTRLVAAATALHFPIAQI